MKQKVDKYPLLLLLTKFYEPVFGTPKLSAFL